MVFLSDTFTVRIVTLHGYTVPFFLVFLSCICGLRVSVFPSRVNS